MKVLVYLGMGVVTLWLQLTMVPIVSIFGTHPNLPLLTVMLVALRWLDPWVFIFGALVGVGMDVFSHGLLGVFGISYFLVAIASRVSGIAVYENNWLSTALLVVALSVLEGVLSLIILEALDPGIPWWLWLFQKVVPVSLYHGALAPLLVPAIDWIEQRYERR